MSFGPAGAAVEHAQLEDVEGHWQASFDEESTEVPEVDIRRARNDQCAGQMTVSDCENKLRETLCIALFAPDQAPHIG